MRKLLYVVLLAMACPVASADVVRTRGGGSGGAASAIVPGTTTTTGCQNRVLYGDNSSLLSCDAGLTYTGALLESIDQTNISGPDATTNVEIGSAANDANAGTGGTSTCVGNACSNASNGADNTIVGSSAAVATAGASRNTVVGKSAAVAGAFIRGVVVGSNASLQDSFGVVIGESAVSQSAQTIVLGYLASVPTGATNSFVAGSPSAAMTNVFFGEGRTDTTASAYAINGTGGSGADNAGADLILAGGRSTGSATPANILFQTSTVAGSSSTLQTLATRLTLTPSRFTATVPWVSATATPAVSNTSANSCGTTAATITGTNETGAITVGATAGTSCTVTFTVAAPNRRQCVVTNETTANLARSTVSSTTVSIFAGTFNGGDVLSYVCMVY
jgi:hypothetical protein